MKKSIIIFAAILLATFANAQNVVINNQTNSGDCGFRINGICSSQDIGGVEIEIHYCTSGRANWKEIAWKQIDPLMIAHYYMIAKNYNSFTVTTLIALNLQGKESVYSGVIPANGVKVFHIGHCTDVEPYSIIGSITRKMAK